MLHEVNRDVSTVVYCGPTAIAAVTKAPISKIHKMIERIRRSYDYKIYGKVVKGGSALTYTGKKRRIGGMYPSELLVVMRRLGFEPKRKGEFKGSLKSFCDDYGHMGAFIVEVTGHFVAVSRGMILDTKTDYKPIPISEYKRLGWRVQKFWQFKEVTNVQPIETL